MKPDKKEKSKDTSFWGAFFSVALHVTVLVLVLFWGFSGTSRNDSSSGPIEVSLSNLDPGGGARSDQPSRPQKAEPPPPKPEPPRVEKEEVVKAPPPPEPEKNEPPEEPEKKVPEKKVEVKKEEKEPEPEKKVVEKEPEPEPEKEVIPLEPEPEKKEVKKEPEKKEPEKEVKKEVAKKPEPTEKPKAPEKKPAVKDKNLESEKSRVIQDIKRQRVLESLKNDSPESEEPLEEMGQEQRLAMADSSDIPEVSREGPGRASENPGGGSGSSVNPVLLKLYTDKVQQRIKRNWRIPPGVPTDGDLATSVFFRVDRSGRVFGVRVNKSSGNAAFDQYCVDAIRKSAPLPPPPSEFAKEAENEGMDITFYNEPF